MAIRYRCDGGTRVVIVLYSHFSMVVRTVAHTVHSRFVHVPTAARISPSFSRGKAREMAHNDRGRQTKGRIGEIKVRLHYWPIWRKSLHLTGVLLSDTGSLPNDSTSSSGSVRFKEFALLRCCDIVTSFSFTVS